MATNGHVNEDADIAERDGEKVVTMMDVLQEEQDFEDDANAVLGASDEKNCTYSKGYIKRQAIYACLTCCGEAKDDATKRAGVCLACSLNCHESHDLIELYTKRNFRCDCGNPKFNSHPCQFTPDKSDFNDDNTYNQNFSGLYCNCHRPYPDPESTVEDDEMIQCIICEDWLHATHINAVVPGNDQYSEMVCKACMENNEFLHDYSNLTVNIETGYVDIIAVNGDTKLTNGDLETEKLMNGLEDTNESFKVDMDVDEAQNENKISATGHTEAVENEDSEKPAEETKENESNDTNALDTEVEIDAENFEETTQMVSDSNLELNDDTNTVAALEEGTEAAENMLEEEKSELQEPKETIPEYVDDESKTTAEATLESEDAEKMVEEDIPELEKPEENSEYLLEPEVKKVEEDIPELEKPEENSEHILEPVIKDKLPEINTDKEKEDETQKLNSVDAEDADSKEEVSQTTTENVDTIEDTKITSADYDNNLNSTSNEIEVNDSSKEPAITDNVDIANEEAMTQKLNGNIEETDKTSNEITPETEINDSAPIVESTETTKDVNTDDISENQIETPNDTITEKEEKKETKRKLSTEEDENDTSVKRPKLDKESKLSEECKINEESKCTRPKGVKKVHKGATFWPSNFRQKLCTCNECLSMYKDLSVLFLIDPEDTVSAYETLGKERVDGRVTQYEKGLEALSSLDHIQQINALTEYNKMKDKLLDFLKSFKDRKEIVKEEDIKAFFAGMTPKREPDGVYFCR